MSCEDFVRCNIVASISYSPHRAETTMQSETIGHFQIEYAGRPLRISGAWGAWVTVYGPSPNPMHRNPIFPARRVALDCQYPDQATAQKEAKVFAESLVAKDNGHSAGKITRADYEPL